MTTDTLDAIADEAVTDLRIAVQAVDTEAALARLRVTTRSPRRRLLAGVSGRPVYVGAVAAVALALLGGILVAGRAGGPAEDVRATPRPTAAAIDPTRYGPVVETLRGPASPTLRADLHAPTVLEDGSAVAVAISGGVPGQEYSLTQCATGIEGYNAAADCVRRGSIVLGDAGRGAAEAVVWALDSGSVVPHLNDCRAVACQLQVQAVGGELDADGPPADRLFGAVEQEPLGFALAFPPDASAPPIPRLEVAVSSTGPGPLVIRLDGRNLAPGRARLLFDGFAEEPDGRMTSLPGVGPVEGETVVVAADGTLSVQVELPSTITETGVRETNGVLDEPRVIRCDEAPAYCTVRIGPPEREARVSSASERVLVPDPIRYPSRG